MIYLRGLIRMKTIANIFEGIFNIDDKKMQDAANNEYINDILKDSNGELSRKLFNMYTYGEYEDHILHVFYKPNHGPCHINADCNIKDYIFDIKGIQSKTRIEISDSKFRNSASINGNTFAPSIAAPQIDIKAKGLKNIKLSTTPGDMYDGRSIILDGLNTIDNVVISSPYLQICCLNELPAFQNVKIHRVKNLSIDFRHGQGNTIANTGLDNLIDWDATIKASGIDSKSIKDGDISALFVKMVQMGLSQSERIKRVKFKPGAQPNECIPGLPLKTVKDIVIYMNKLTFCFYKSTKIRDWQIIPDSEWSFIVE